MTISNYHVFMIDTVITCGSDRIALWQSDGWQLLGSWDLKQLPELSPDEQSWVTWYRGCSDEALPDREHPGDIILTAVSGLVARLSISTSACTVLAWEPGAHSLCNLPGGLIAVAVSNSPGACAPGLPEPQRSSVPIYRADGSRHCCSRLPISDAHGLFWDLGRERLWILGGDELFACQLHNETLLIVERWQLPEPHGHALAEGGGDELLISTGTGAWCFDREQGSFSAIAALSALENIKGLSRHPHDGRLLWTQPRDGSFYGDVYCDGSKLPIEDAVYKARWRLV